MDDSNIRIWKFYCSKAEGQHTASFLVMSNGAKMTCTVGLNSVHACFKISVLSSLITWEICYLFSTLFLISQKTAPLNNEYMIFEKLLLLSWVPFYSYMKCDFKLRDNFFVQLFIWNYFTNRDTNSLIYWLIGEMFEFRRKKCHKAVYSSTYRTGSGCSQQQEKLLK